MSTALAEPSQAVGPRRAAGFSLTDGLSVLTSLAAAVLWRVGVDHVHLGRMNDLGLVSVLDGWFWLALLCTVTAFVLALRTDRPRTAVVGLALVILIVVILGTPAAAEGTPRLEASFRHLGLVDQISAGGHLDRSVDAYFNWPGLFAMIAFFADATGVHDLTMLATMAPVLAGLAYLAPLVLILKTLTTNLRVQWLAIGLFYLLNWTGQDYMAPQTFAFWLYLCIVALLLRLSRTMSDDFMRPKWLRRLFPATRSPAVARVSGQGAVDPRSARVLLTLVLVDTVAIICSHQLTPFVLIVTLGVLWVVGRGQLWLVVFAVAATLLWLLVPAWPFLSGHLTEIIPGLGKTSGSAQANVTSRFSGSPDHQVVVIGRVAEALGAWLVALGGAVLLRRRRRNPLGPLMLLGSPFLLLPLQSYGGEMVIRVYLFSLPLTAYLGAMALSRLTDDAPARRANVMRTCLLIVIVSLVGAATLVARYGNERGEAFRPDEIRATEAIYARHDPQAVVLSLTTNTPWRFHRYSTLTYESLEDGEPGAAWTKKLTPSLVVHRLRKSHSGIPEYVLYTRSQSAMADLAATAKTGVVASVAGKLAKDPRFTVIFRSPHALVLLWNPS